MGSAPGREIKLAVMPAYSRSKNGVAFARLWRGHPRLAFLMLRTDVDGRDKPGHDEPWVLRKGGLPPAAFVRVPARLVGALEDMRRQPAAFQRLAELDAQEARRGV